MSSTPSTLTLGSPFTNHLVLQRSRANAIWGWDVPHQRISLFVAGPRQVSVSTQADEQGYFRLDCPELEWEGPYELTIHGSSSITLHDVLVGEVWLVSGQSNMEWPLSGVQNAEAEIQDARFPKVRFFSVQQQPTEAPCTRVNGEWLECTPENAEAFSAVGYFFARALHEELRSPIGIINASWGGTPIEAWTSSEGLQGLPGMQAALEKQRTLAGEVPRLLAAAQRQISEWERTALPNDPGNAGFERGWADPQLDDTSWPDMRVPGSWQSRGLRHNGVVWFRKSVVLPPDWVGRDLVLSLGMIDDFDETYVNGVSVGAHPKGTPEAYRIQRRYEVRKELVTGQTLSIAVRVFDHFGEGGFMGPGVCMRLALTTGSIEPLELTGNWKYQVEHAIPTVPATVFQTYPKVDVPLPQYRLSALFNGMIAPLVPFGFRGALWYQGESNVDQHASYRDHMIAMVRDWRGRFGAGQFPFYFVQLASFSGGSNWPYLREAQSQALSEPNTGMVTAIDIGEPNDIHPRNKQEVGRRLARLALARCYDQRGIACEGPQLRRVEIQGNIAKVVFDCADGLNSGNDAVQGFELAGDDGLFVPASATIQGECVLVEFPKILRPIHVRYAWHDAPSVNLKNRAGLPALPFRTDGRRT